MISREDMVQALVQNDIDWVVGDPTHENVKQIVRFFTNGGFGNYTDSKIEEMYNKLTA
jgi:hypothetical protein